ncbi:23S rRNA (guanosine-2'-O-) -methyltransferase rlmB [Thioalkalivibrio nitratireducens DSM 14787]|uniref:23S rRNA (guanosine-2'-O-)-methyltransferase RlmB n=1 Tax=Thioalkalivibrio nitratireducens (strain DSM 14787 / UNIQEM 213 / ALEN2) TaxID=1255043 RepID=L0E0U5_THIND|nr:23S rRNA (guanosine(2251)-2'-O)-methyltransferase RlmB [Thioalkalivibrio nitratireducens]AGA34898.1 23S rRNA (guanosine-2'-O-) -methyltransferase rlmB [Thioalkalivibrio nitratireducens DSM 14787]
MNTPEVVGGLHAVEALLSHGAERVKRIQVAAGAADARVAAVATRARALGISVERVQRERLERAAGGLRHQGVLAWVKPRDRATEVDLADRVAAGATLLLALDGVTDPHNLGACLRSADAAGAAAVIVPRDRSAQLTPAAAKAASGAAETVPVVAVANLARTLRQLRDQGFWVVGLAGDTGGTLYDLDLTVPTVLVLGAEGEGLRRLTREHCDHLAAIPMLGTVGSLNVSVATGIALFEAVRQRQAAIRRGRAQ